MTENDEMATEGVAERATEALKAIFGEAAPSAIFSAPQQVGDSIVITASAWERAGGFGFGSGSGADEQSGSGSGAGGGGGGSSQGRPVAVIRVGSKGLEVRPVIDFTKIGVTVLLGVVGLLGALRRGR